MSTKGIDSKSTQELQLLKKRPSQTADYTMLARPTTSRTQLTGDNSTARESRPIGQTSDDRIPQRPKDVYGPSKDPGRTSEGVHILARTVPLPRTSSTAASYNGQEELQKDMDIFRSEEAMKEFANQAYQSARSKYF